MIITSSGMHTVRLLPRLSPRYLFCRRYLPPQSVSVISHYFANKRSLCIKGSNYESIHTSMADDKPAKRHPKLQTECNPKQFVKIERQRQSAPSSLPWLVLPPTWEQDGLKFYCHEDEFYHIKPMELSHDNGICLGSCYGWLLYLNDAGELMLLNPFTKNQILLPPLFSFPDIHKVEDGKYDKIEFKGSNLIKVLLHDSPVPVRGFRRQMRTKAVLSSQPSGLKEESVGVVVMYTFGNDVYDFYELRYKNLAFCTTAADDSKWTKLNDEHKWYLDIMSHEDQFYALREDFSIEVWDFPNGSFPIQRRVIQADASLVPPRGKGEYQFIFDDYWIVKAGEEILLLVLNKASRFEQRPELILVYKLDSGEKWTKVESIGNHALLLGFNQPILIPGQGNQDFNPKGSVYVITKVPYSSGEIKGFRYFASVFNLGDSNSPKRLKEVSKGGHHFDLSARADPTFYWVEAPLVTGMPK